MWVEFTAAYDHLWLNRSMTRFEPGKRNVKREVGERAVAKGKAVELTPLTREEAESLGQSEDGET